ncbi:MAG: hypothetical protein IPP90_06995 [Gemmatimonadaceae bacterium]|nr:hypothetical protein [Gemmatimonadaceae bacterium]
MPRRVAAIVAAIVAVVFGIVTVIAGGRVLFGGSDPGYVVFRPLLMFNTAMGVAYITAGLAIWRGAQWRVVATGTIAVLNLVVLGAIVFVYARGGGVAIDSLRAMTFRSVVWLALLVSLAWKRNRNT